MQAYHDVESVAEEIGYHLNLLLPLSRDAALKPKVYFIVSDEEPESNLALLRINLAMIRGQMFSGKKMLLFCLKMACQII